MDHRDPFPQERASGTRGEERCDGACEYTAVEGAEEPAVLGGASVLVGIALVVLALLIKTFLLQAFSIPSGTMQNTLQKGDRVLVDKLTPWFGSEPERGEVVVFHDPADWLGDVPVDEPNTVQKVLSFIGVMPSAEEKDLIKRVIGVAGDTVECAGEGPVKVNGAALNEPYASRGAPGATTSYGGRLKVTVPKGKIWVMGDHRQASSDSRYHQDDATRGMVPVDEVVRAGRRPPGRSAAQCTFLSSGSFRNVLELQDAARRFRAGGALSGARSSVRSVAATVSPPPG
ncbi:hypothetical protein SCALM49S_09636 [Streptomyces californicus]